MRLVYSLLLLTLIPVASQAEEFDYSYVELGYANVDLDLGGGLDVDGDGFGINGSFAIGNDVHLFASYSSVDFDFSVEVNQLELGAGMHFELTPTMDMVGTVSYLDAEVDSGLGSFSEDGFGIGLGVRAAAGENIEWEAGLDYADLGSSNTTIRLEGRYSFSSNSAVGIGFAFDDDVTTIIAGVRFEFGE